MKIVIIMISNNFPSGSLHIRTHGTIQLCINRVSRIPEWGTLKVHQDCLLNLVSSIPPKFEHGPEYNTESAGSTAPESGHCVSHLYVSPLADFVRCHYISAKWYYNKINLWHVCRTPYLLFSTWFTVSRMDLNGSNYEVLVDSATNVGPQAVDYHLRCDCCCIYCCSHSCIQYPMFLLFLQA